MALFSRVGPGFVRGLPFSATEATVKKDFEECGEMVSVNVPLNDEGNAHGVAFINFKDYSFDALELSKKN